MVIVPQVSVRSEMVIALKASVHVEMVSDPIFSAAR
jgi:hypothetical protein